MTDILIIRSNCDPATFGTYNLGDGLMTYLQGKGHTVTELADTAASPANVQYWLTSTANRTTKLVIGLDHGSTTGFYGEVNNQITEVIGTANVKDLTQTLHVYTFACSTCANGGLAATGISQGTLSWLGYTEPVYVFTDPNTALFKTLKEVIWTYITKLADGFTLEAAEKALRDAYTAHNGDNPVFGYNLARLLLRKTASGMTIHSHNRPTTTRIPLYRYWNPGGADHFYTTNWGELGTGRYGWHFEGVQCYVCQNQVSGSVPLYRYWNSSIADHFYTTNWGELGSGRYGWIYEGVQCYVYQNQVSGSVPLYRYWNSGAGDHFYTTNWGELGSGRYGWGYEGVQCYVFQNSIGASTTPDTQIPTETSELPEEGGLVPIGFSTLGATEQLPLSFATSIATDQPPLSFSIAESAPTQPSTFSISTFAR